MSNKEKTDSLFSNQILPAIIEIIKKIVDAVLSKLQFRIDLKKGYVAYNGA